MNLSSLYTSRADTVDQGLRSYMLKIYNYMAAALVMTGAVAFTTAHSEPMLRLCT